MKWGIYNSRPDEAFLNFREDLPTLIHPYREIYDWHSVADIQGQFWHFRPIPTHAILWIHDVEEFRQICVFIDWLQHLRLILALPMSLDAEVLHLSCQVRPRYFATMPLNYEIIKMVVRKMTDWEVSQQAEIETNVREEFPPLEPFSNQ
jgi:hypothetical protein